MLKCLRKDPQDRYPNLQALADDLRAFREERSISARPMGTVEKSAKWVRKNRRVAITMLAFALTLTAGTLVSLFYADRATRSAKLASDREQDAIAAAGRADAASQREKERADEALREKQRADEASKQAAQSATREKYRADEALREKQRAETQLTRAEKLVYTNNIQAAQRYWNDGFAKPAFDALDSCRWDYRGWEHDYLHTTFNRGYVSFQGHTSMVLSVSFSPDGKRIVSGGWDGTVKVWDAVSGQEQLTLKGHTTGVNCVSFSPDGKRIVSGGGQFDKPGEVKVWDAVSGQEQLTLKRHTGRVTSVSFSPDGKRIVSGSGDGTVKVWDAVSGQEQLTLKGHTEHVASVSFSPDGKRIVSGSWDNTVKVWDAVSGQEQLTLKGHTEHVASVSFSPDGKRIVSGSGDRTVKVWDAVSGQEQLMLKGHTERVYSVSFSPDGRRIVSGSWDNTVKVWDAVSGQEQLTLKGHTSSVLSVSFSPDGRIAYGQDVRGRILAWNSLTGQLYDEKPQAMPAGSLLTSPDGKTKLVLDNDVAYVERLDNRGPDGLTQQQRWDRERLAKWAAWNPQWHTRQATDAEQQQQWFAARFHLRLLVQHAPHDAELAARLKVAEAKLNPPTRELAPLPRAG